MVNYSKQVILYRGKAALYKLISLVLEGYEYCKKLMKRHFNKNLVMSKKV